MEQDKFDKDQEIFRRETALDLAMRFINSHNNVNKEKLGIDKVIHAAEIMYLYMIGEAKIKFGGGISEVELKDPPNND